MESKKIDPYKVLNINKNFTLEQLKEAYKTMALKVHPDKGGSEYLFKLVTLCYKSLVKEYNARVGDKQYFELKTDYTKYTANQPRAQTEPSDPKSFNLDKFNRIFDENKIESVTDIGYGSFLKNTPAIDEPKKVINKFTQESFNSTFEKHNNSYAQNKHLVKYREPEPLLTSKKISFTEIGNDSIDDFSGDNTSKKHLNYMDLKIAHTTSRIVDPRTVAQRKEYKSVDDFEADRSQISYHMSDSDREYYEKMKRMEMIKEKKRLQYVTKQDKQTAEQFEKLHRLMLGT
jgi:curved DNA-binding protein CbpA